MNFLVELNSILEPLANIALILILPTLYKHELRIQKVETVQALRKETRGKI
jgi:hypothetical protein